jgi:AcrR family transcriptional regulator
MTTRTPSLRERQRAQVLGEIQRSALSLFAERGYDAVTTEEIATAAGVSLSTYFRHVSGKDELLLGPMRRAGHVIVANLRDRPAGEPPAAALTAAITAWSETFAEANDAVAQWRDVILGAPHLLRRITLIAADDRERVVELVAERMRTDRAVDRRPGLLVHVLFAATEYAYQRWLVEGTDWTSLHEITCQALDVTTNARWQ